MAKRTTSQSEAAVPREKRRRTRRGATQTSGSAAKASASKRALSGRVQAAKSSRQQIGRSTAAFKIVEKPLVQVAEDVIAIVGPAKYSRESAAGPEFFVNCGKGRWWAIEVAATPELFAGTDPNDVFASWRASDRLFEPTGPTVYVLPREAWEQLRANQELFYRLLTSTAANSWQDYIATTGSGRGPGRIELFGRFTRRLPDSVIRPEEDLWRRDG